MASIHEKNGRWHIRIRIVNKPTVCASFLRRSDATAWAKATEADVLAGRYRPPSPAVPGLTTVGDLLQKYANAVSVTKRGAREERNVVSLMGRSALSRTVWSKRLADIKPADFARLRDAWLASGLAAATVRNRLALCSSAFQHGRREWGLDDLANAVAEIKRPSLRNERARRLVGNELDRIIAATRDEELVCLVTLLVETAMRRSEALCLTWDHVHLAERYVHLKTTKNGTTRDVPLSPLAVAVLRDMPKRGDRVFRLTPNAASLAFGRAVIRAKENYESECACLGRTIDPAFLLDLRLHDLRREAASRMIESGIFNVIEAAAITGHRQIAVLHRRYSVLQTPRLADKLAQAEAKRATEAMASASAESPAAIAALDAARKSLPEASEVL